MRNYLASVRRWGNKADVVFVDQVTPQAAARFVEARLSSGVSPVTVAVDFAAVLAILDHEERAGRFDPDVQQRVRRCAPALPRKRELTAPFLTREQVEAYCAGADDPLAVFVVRLACYTGLRASELAELDWADVDLQGRTLHVRRGKTGPRRVSLCAPAVNLLRGRAADRGLVLGGASAKALLERVRRGRAGSGLRVTLTLCRHTRASWWIAAGVPVALVAKALGHSVTICLKHYGGLSDGYDATLERGAAG